MEADDPIEIDYQLEFGEFYRGLRWYAWKRYWWLYCILVILVTIQLTNSVFRTANNSSSGRLSEYLPTVAIPVGLIALFYWSIYRNAKRQFRTNSSLREMRRSVFSANGVESSTPSSSGKLAWNMFHKVAETPELFFLFTSSAAFIVIPKRGLPNEERTRALRGLIKEKLGSKARLQR
jgi:hypothetical protein